MNHLLPNRVVSAVVASLAIAGCGDDHEEHHNESPAEEACEHFIEGPNVEISANSDPEAELSLASVEHTRVDIALATLDDGNGGYVAFGASEDGEYQIFLNAAVQLVIFDGTGTEVEFEETVAGSEHCSELAVMHAVDLAVGTYTFGFGPTTETSVGLVAEASGSHADE